MNVKPSLVGPTLPQSEVIKNLQLEVAKDPELMMKILQRHLRPLHGEAYQIRGCQISRAHYRKATRRILRYSLRLEEAGTGRERIQLVTGVMYVDGSRTRQEWKELQRSEPTIPYALLTFEPFFFIPELGMLVQVFPYDHRLPTLPFLMAGPPPELEPLLLARFGEGDRRIEAWDVEPVRYRNGARVTLRLRVRARDEPTGRVEERRFYAKVYREEEDGKRTYEVGRKLWEGAEAGGEGFTTARPVVYLSDLRTLIQEEAAGSSLRDVLLQEEEATPAVRRAARALAALHLGEVSASRRPRPSKEDFDRRTKSMGRNLQQACPHLRPEIEEIVGAVVAAGPEEEAPTAPTHGDLHLRHILLDGDRLSLIDLDTLAEADPLLDVALVLSDIAVMPFDSPLPRDHARKASRAFVEEYFAHVPESWRDRFPLRYARAVLKKGVKIYRRQSQPPGWPDMVEALIEEAKGSLAGRER